MRKNGFTLIELMVVVGIIVLLIGILIPVLGKAKTLARRAETEAMMTNLATGIDSYYMTFHAYPGPAGVDVTASSGATKISGAQNLLLGATYAIDPSLSPGTGIVSLPFDSTRRTNPNEPDGPLNLANINPEGKFEQLSTFIDPTPKQLSKAESGIAPTAIWPNAGVSFNVPPTLGASNQFRFPVLMDAFSDGLPILYYRRTAGVEGVSSVAYAANATSGYYWMENAEYTTASITSTSGTVFDQKLGTMSTPGGELSGYTQNGSKGGYLLISAGIDRLYGNAKTLPATYVPDDIIRVGGN